MNIQITKRSINSQESLNWMINDSMERDKFEEFILQMNNAGVSEKKASQVWLQNYGAIPLSEPNKFYSCAVIDNGIKLTVTVMRENTKDSSKFKVVKINKVFLDRYDYTKEYCISKEGLKHKIEYKDLVTSNNGEAVNYEDKSWFKLESINALLDKFKLRFIKNEATNKDRESRLIINGMNLMESSEVEIYDKDFEKELYKKIETRFEEVVSDLK